MSRSVTSRLFSVSNPREVWLITVAHAVNEFYSVALPPILPLLVNDFAITYGEPGVLLAVYFATYSHFQLLVGVLANRIGQRWLLAGGWSCSQPASSLLRTHKDIGPSSPR